VALNVAPYDLRRRGPLENFGKQLVKLA